MRWFIFGRGIVSSPKIKRDYPLIPSLTYWPTEALSSYFKIIFFFYLLLFDIIIFILSWLIITLGVKTTFKLDNTVGKKSDLGVALNDF